MSLKLATALVAAALTSSPALACMGPTVLLSDNFQTANAFWLVPSWVVPPGMSAPFITFPPILNISGGHAQLTPLPGDFALAEVGGLPVDGGDACVDVLSPAVADPSQAAAGIMFGVTGSGFYVFAVEEDGQAAVLQYQSATRAWLYLVPWRAAPALTPGGNVTNTLRVTWNGTSGAAYINAQPFATFSLPKLTNAAFGIWCEGDPGVNATAGATYQFTNFKLTNVAP